eukprot:gene12919-biopygen12520
MQAFQEPWNPVSPLEWRARRHPCPLEWCTPVGIRIHWRACVSRHPWPDLPRCTGKRQRAQTGRRLHDLIQRTRTRRGRRRFPQETPPGLAIHCAVGCSRGGRKCNPEQKMDC